MDKYEIEVQEDFVEIYGYLTIEESINLINFFYAQGFVNIIPGEENSTIHLSRNDLCKRNKDLLDEEKKSHLEKLLEEEQKRTKDLKKILEDQNSVFELLNKDLNEKISKLITENKNLKRVLNEHRLINNPEIRKIIDPIY
jgi:predicted nucleotide-binding protein (sugar kinase/HSP70/actin superfamily)